MNKVLFSFVVFITLNSHLFAQSDSNRVKKIHTVPHVTETIKLDAKLDEAFWQKAAHIDANIEVRPGENIPAPVKTVARVVYTNTHIYIGFIAYDPEPEKIRAHFSDRDDIFQDDWILILFDTFNDQRRTYDFACNPLGVQGDMIESSSGEGDSWDAIWDSHGRITDEGYVVEMSIPFSSLSFPRTEGEQTWGFDVVRSYPRNVRHHIGTWLRDRNNNCYMCQADKLAGFAGVQPGNNIELDPTMTASMTQEREHENTEFVTKDKLTEMGISGHWRVFKPWSIDDRPSRSRL